MQWWVPAAIIIGLLLQAVLPLRKSRPLWGADLRFHFLFAGFILLEVYLLRLWDPLYPKHSSFRWEWVLLALLALDLLSYVWHRLNHRVPWLWRWHSFHHRAESLDALAAFRFHPLEIFLGYQLRAVVVFLLGFSAQELAVFIAVFGVMNVFQHSGVRLPQSLEDWLSWIVVTPRRHHVHHYRSPTYRDSNFATVFIFWDRLFGTYKDPLPDDDIDLGLSAQP